MQKEEEMNKQTKLNAGAATMRNGDHCMDVHLAFDIKTTIEEFMAIISTQHKQKKNHAKTTIRGKKRRS